MPALRALLALAVLTSLAVHGAALRCHKCVAASESECGKQGSHSCPQYADACATITAPNSVVKSCSYKSFCEQARGGGAAGGATVRCCFSDECNGAPRSARSAGDRAPPPRAALLAAAPLLLPLLLLPRAL